jgi:hypothetical protein
MADDRKAFDIHRDVPEDVRPLRRELLVCGTDFRLTACAARMLSERVPDVRGPMTSW